MSFSETKNNNSPQNDKNEKNSSIKIVKSFYYNEENRSDENKADSKPNIKTAGRSHFYTNDAVEPLFYSDDFLKSESKSAEEKDAHCEIVKEGIEESSLPKEQPDEIATAFDLSDVQTKPVTDTKELSVLERNKAALASLRVSDINKPDATKKAKSGVLRKIALSFFVIVIAFSSLNIVYQLYLKNVANKYYENIRESFYSNELSVRQTGYLTHDVAPKTEERLYSDEGDIYVPSEVEVLDMHTKFEKMLPNIVALKKINSGVFAWIKVEGTRVDYPVVKSPQGNNDYYLDHALDRTYNVSGSVFTDYNNSTKLSQNRNTCVYGHNMNDGTMFQTIMNFKTKNQFDTGTIEMYTADGIHIYTPISAYEAHPTEMFFHTQFEDDSHFQLFLNDITSKSIYTPPVVPKVTDKIITLITCTNTITDKRFVVHGVLKEIVK